MSSRLTCTAGSGLVAQDRPGRWLAEEPGPRFSLAPQSVLLSPGWYRLRLLLRSVAADADARLLLAPADGSPERALRLPVALNGRVDHVFRLPWAVSGLGLRPFSGRGALLLEDPRLDRLSWSARATLQLVRVGLAFWREGGAEAFARWEALPVEPDVTLIPDGSRLERLYRLAKRRMALRFLPPADYASWVACWEPSASPPPAFSGPSPRFSVLVPLDGDEAAALRSLASLREQTCQDFECLLAAAPERMVRAAFLCRELPWARPVASPVGVLHPEPFGAARGQHIMVLPPNDVLAPAALACLAEALERRPALHLLYSDEDRMGLDGVRRDPLFKPGWDPDLALAWNCFPPAFACERELALRCLPLPGLSLAAGLYRLALFAAEAAGAEGVARLPRVLLHRRDAPLDSALPGEELAVARDFCAAARPGFTVVPEAGGRRVRAPEPESWPLVSAIIPTRDGLEVLRPCVESLLGQTDYPGLELIIVDNGSSDLAILEYLAGLGARGLARVLRLDMPFNYSRLNNLAAAQARGTVLLFLNNDMEVREPSWLKALVAQALRPEVGAVGAFLLYPDGLVQHAGVGLGIHGLAGHLFKGGSPDVPPACAPWLCRTRRVSAVTGACLALRRELFEAVGGFDEALPGSFNDVDLCLRLSATGRHNILVAEASLLHYESYTRGREEDAARRRRERKARILLCARWGQVFERDPHGNPNLSRASEHCGLALFSEPEAD